MQLKCSDTEAIVHKNLYAHALKEEEKTGEILWLKRKQLQIKQYFVAKVYKPHIHTHTHSSCRLDHDI